MRDKIKISAPRSNPHICYIPIEYKDMIQDLRTLTGLSTYALLCKLSGCDLSTSENIAKFKAECREEGFRNIGEWATVALKDLYSMRDDLTAIDFSTLEVKKNDNRS